MKKFFKRSLALLLSMLFIFSVFSSGASAEKMTAAEAVLTLDKNIPIIEIPGFGEPIYKGLSTESELDDVSIWNISAEEITSLVQKHLKNLILGLLLRNFEDVDAVFTDVLTSVFGDAVCDENGVPSPDTGIKAANYVVPKREYGYANSYSFRYDWRLDMHTLSSQLNDFINQVMEATGSEEVGLVCFSMGGCVTMTYLYEYYYLAEAEERDHIRSVVFLSGAMNGVGCCEDPFSGNIILDSTSLMRMLQETLGNNVEMLWLYRLLDIMYSFRLLEPVVNFSNNYIVGNMGKMVDKALPQTLGTIPGFCAMMSEERYRQAEDFIFNSEDEKAKYSVLIEKNRYYHNSVQANSGLILDALLEDGKNLAIVSEYGFSSLPVTSDNNRMSDGTIETYATSFGATCAEVDKTFGENYIQASPCDCGETHISPDNQIDASTCRYPDLTWFAKNVKHSSADRYFENLVDLVTYSEGQVTVRTYPDLPQYMINQLDLRLIPMTSSNAGQVIPFDETTVIAQFFKNLFG